MDLDAGADDFFAALNSGETDAFADFSIPEEQPATTPVARHDDQVRVQSAALEAGKTKWLGQVEGERQDADMALAVICYRTGSAVRAC